MGIAINKTKRLGRIVKFKVKGLLPKPFLAAWMVVGAGLALPIFAI
jgi:hypothetical protein